MGYIETLRNNSQPFTIAPAEMPENVVACERSRIAKI